MDVKSERPSFLIYKSFYEPIKILSYENKGKLFEAIFEYQINGKLEAEPQIQMAFAFFKNQFELDQKKWEKKIVAQIDNGKKGGRPRNSSEITLDEKPKKPNQTHGFFKNPTKPKKGVKGKEKEKEKVNIDIKMATPRRFAKNEIQNTGKKEDLIDLWENNFSDAWKQDSKIKGMYENKLSEFED
ncbi:uncharacterized protein METZ01_LOCUS463827 [marine metagenome]|uniref:DUF6291 domain-containing protein n=1 Tax=marine metagenome TaxID=408172 RepID=A0A383ATS8_9ZZZZ